eukprot:m.1274034 g.1274034  ORF g.1274034 m.1274034 type:complete len:544 (+) comp24757_c0_seq3:551-2182(+)
MQYNRDNHYHPPMGEQQYGRRGGRASSSSGHDRTHATTPAVLSYNVGVSNTSAQLPHPTQVDLQQQQGLMSIMPNSAASAYGPATMHNQGGVYHTGPVNHHYIQSLTPQHPSSAIHVTQQPLSIPQHHGMHHHQQSQPQSTYAATFGYHTAIPPTGVPQSNQGSNSASSANVQSTSQRSRKKDKRSALNETRCRFCSGGTKPIMKTKPYCSACRHFIAASVGSFSIFHLHPGISSHQKHTFMQEMLCSRYLNNEIATARLRALSPFFSSHISEFYERLFRVDQELTTLSTKLQSLSDCMKNGTWNEETQHKLQVTTASLESAMTRRMQEQEGAYRHCAKVNRPQISYTQNLSEALEKWKQIYATVKAARTTDSSTTAASLHDPLQQLAKSILGGHRDSGGTVAHASLGSVASGHASTDVKPAKTELLTRSRDLNVGGTDKGPSRHVSAEEHDSTAERSSVRSANRHIRSTLHTLLRRNDDSALAAFLDSLRPVLPSTTADVIDSVLEDRKRKSASMGSATTRWVKALVAPAFIGVESTHVYEA